MQSTNVGMAVNLHDGPDISILANHYKACGLHLKMVEE
jgi:hypothetical protein